MDNPGLNSLLKWSIENSEGAQNADGDGSSTQRTPNRGLDQTALAQLLGGPSDADRMRDTMIIIGSPDTSLDDKLIAFDNFEQLIENLDNANNMENMGLWMPLVDQLDSSEPEIQRFAAWCIATAIQNNVRTQERCLVVGAVPKLARLALNGQTTALRKKAILALSSEARNYQPGLDAVVKALPNEYSSKSKLDATNMEDVDSVIDQLRASVG